MFTPGAERNGPPYASFTFQVQDDGGTANGGVDLDPSRTRSRSTSPRSTTRRPGRTTRSRAPEDATYTFTAADFGFTDPNDTPANALLAVQDHHPARRPAALTLDGRRRSTAGPRSSRGRHHRGQARCSRRRPTPTAPPTPTSRSRCRDNGGTANGGIDLDPTPTRSRSTSPRSTTHRPARTRRSRRPKTRRYTFAAADFGFTDPNDTPANRSRSVVITSLPGAGSADLSRRRGRGRPVNRAGEYHRRQPACSRRRPTPTAPPYASFTFQVQRQRRHGQRRRRTSIRRRTRSRST